MSHREKRRSPRCRAFLPLLVRSAGSSEQLFTVEISLRGLFAVAEIPRPKGQLLSLTVVLPEGDPFDAQSIVSRSVSAREARENGVPPGMALQFYGLSKTASARWEAVFLQARQLEAENAPPLGSDNDTVMALPYGNILLDEIREQLGRSPSLVIVPDDMAAALASPPAPPPPPEPRDRTRPPDRAAPPVLQPPPSSPASSTPKGQPTQKLLGLPQGAAPSAGPGAPKREAPPQHRSSAARTSPQAIEESLRQRARLTPVLGRPAPPEAKAPSPADPGPAEFSAPAGTALDLAPDETVGASFYRLTLPSVDALAGFARTALLVQGGVFLRTQQLRAPGTPAVLCMVHPSTGGEFHLPGEIVPNDRPRRGVAIEFVHLSRQTISDFCFFVVLGLSQDQAYYSDSPLSQSAQDDAKTNQAAASPSAPSPRRENTHEVTSHQLENYHKKQ